MKKIPTYIINIKSRTDRYEHSQAQFADRNEFDPVIIEAKTDEHGNVGLWNSVKYIVV